MSGPNTALVPPPPTPRAMPGEPRGVALLARCAGWRRSDREAYFRPACSLSARDPNDKVADGAERNDFASGDRTGRDGAGAGAATWSS